MFTRYVFKLRDPVSQVPNDYSKVPFEADVSGNGLYIDNCPNGLKVAFDDPSNEQFRVFPGHTIRRPSGFSRLYFFTKADYVDWTGVNFEILVLSGDADVRSFDTRPRFTQGYLIPPGPAGASQNNALTYAQARSMSELYQSGAQSDAASHTIVQHTGFGGYFRLLRYMIEVSGNATLAAAGIVTIQLNDINGTLLHSIQHDFYLPNAVPAAAQRQSTGWIDLGPVGLIVPNLGDGVTKQGLNARASIALASGSWRVYVGVSAE